MTLFYFDINDGKTRSTDHKGHEFSGLEAARKAATVELAEMISDEMPNGGRECFVVTIRDKDRKPVYVTMASMMGEPLI